jgi:hypothetical protein
MAFIGNQPAESFTSFATQEFSTSATTSYTLDHAVTNENEIALFVNNVRQQPGSGKAYTASGTTLTLSAATASTDTMYCVFLGRALQTVNPATNSITSAMISDDAITGAKLNTDVISAQTALGAEPADTDEFLVSDAGVLKRVDYSYIKGGDWTKIAHTNVTSATSSVDFVHGTGGVVIDSTYRYYKVLFTWRPSTNAAVLAVRVSNSGTFRTSGYLAEVFRSYYSGGTARTNSTTNILVGTGGTQNASDQRSNAELTFYNMSDSDLNTTAQLLSVAIDGSGNTENQVNNQVGGGVYASPEAHDGIRISMHTGNIEEGEFTLIGLKG